MDEAGDDMTCGWAMWDVGMWGSACGQAVWDLDG